MIASTSQLHPPATHRRSATRGGFTLVEVLATLLLLAIALPAVQQGISMATAAATDAQRRTQAAALAEAKLNELISTMPQAGSTTSFQLGASGGDFTSYFNGAQSPFTWSAELNPWGQYVGVNGNNQLQELDVHVMWQSGKRQEILSVSTLVYQSANTSGSTSSGTTGGIQ